MKKSNTTKRDLISYDEIAKLGGVTKNTLGAYQKKTHKDGRQVFPSPAINWQAGAARQPAMFDEVEALNGLKRIKEYQEHAKIKKLEAIERKSKFYEDDRMCRPPTNYVLAMNLLNECLTV